MKAALEQTHAFCYWAKHPTHSASDEGGYQKKGTYELRESKAPDLVSIESKHIQSVEKQSVRFSQEVMREHWSKEHMACGRTTYESLYQITWNWKQSTYILRTNKASDLVSTWWREYQNKRRTICRRARCKTWWALNKERFEANQLPAVNKQNIWWSSEHWNKVRTIRCRKRWNKKHPQPVDW